MDESGCILLFAYLFNGFQGIYGELPNLALNKPAYQSSLYSMSFSPVAAKAVDGNPNTNLNDGSCSLTSNEDSHAWWLVELASDLYDVTVTSLEIYHRSDYPGAAELMRDFEIRVGNTFDQENFDPTTFDLCYAYVGHLNFNDVYYDCVKPMNGRYVTIFIPHYGCVQLCEVIVRGSVHLKESRKFIKPGVSQPDWHGDIVQSFTVREVSACWLHCHRKWSPCAYFAVKELDGANGFLCKLYNTSAITLQISTSEFLILES